MPPQREARLVFGNIKAAALLKRTTLLHNVLERNPIGELKPKAAKPKRAKPKKAPVRKAPKAAKAPKAQKAPLRKAKAKPRYKKGGLVKSIDGIAMRGKTKATRSR